MCTTRGTIVWSEGSIIVPFQQEPRLHLLDPIKVLVGKFTKKSDFLNLGNFQQTSLKLAIRTFSNQWGSMSWSWACHRPTMRIISKSPNEIALHFAKGVTRQMSNRRKSRFSVWLGFFLFFFRYQLKIKYVQNKISFLRDLRIQRVFSRWVSHQSKEQLFTLFLFICYCPSLYQHWIIKIMNRKGLDGHKWE